VRYVVWRTLSFQLFSSSLSLMMALILSMLTPNFSLMPRTTTASVALGWIMLWT